MKNYKVNKILGEIYVYEKERETNIESSLHEKDCEWTETNMQGKL